MADVFCIPLLIVNCRFSGAFAVTVTVPAAEHVRRFLRGKSLHADQEQHFAVTGRDRAHRALERVELAIGCILFVARVSVVGLK